MNVKCTICDAVLFRPTGERCPECGARPEFQVKTAEAPRHASERAGEARRAWEFSPDGPVLRRIH